MERFRGIRFTLIVCCLGFALEGSAQIVEVDNFSATPVAQKVLINWTMRAGNTCSGTRIFRGTDSLQMAEVGSIDGICGDVAFSVSYAWIDSFPPLGSLLYYKLEFGGLGNSPLITTRAFDLSTGYQIITSETNTTIVFRESGGEAVTVTLLDLAGRTIERKSTVENAITISAGTIHTGVYIFLIEFPASPAISGKIFIR